MHKYIAIALASAAILAGCATPVTGNPGPRTVLDKDTSYSVIERPDGFQLDVSYARYQFIPESSSVAEACRQALTATAFDLADKRGRKIEPVNQQRIRISMGRNGFSGMTTCEASAPVLWASP
jgi:hypothetical protein